MSASIRDSLARAIELKTERESKAKDHFRISSMGQCHRAQIGMRAGLPPVNPFTDRVRFKLWMGTMLGREIQKELMQNGFLDPAFHELEVKYQSYVGHIDGCTNRLPTGKAIVEIKTADDNAISIKGVEREWPEHYQWQGLTYCLATGVKYLLLFQIGKNQGLSREKIVTLNDQWISDINHEIELVNQAWDMYSTSHALPPCRHRFGWEDRTCPFLNLPVNAPRKPVEPLGVVSMAEKKITDPGASRAVKKASQTAVANPFSQTKESQELADWLDQQLPDSSSENS